METTGVIVEKHTAKISPIPSTTAKYVLRQIQENKIPPMKELKQFCEDPEGDFKSKKVRTKPQTQFYNPVTPTIPRPPPPKNGRQYGRAEAAKILHDF